MVPIGEGFTVSGHRLIVLIMIGLLAAAGCSDRDGGDPLTPAWTHETGGAIGVPPVIVDDIVVVAPEGGPVVAMDLESGARRWQFEPHGRVWHRSLATDGTRIFVGLEGGRLAAINAPDGSLTWEQTLGIETQHAPLIDDGVVFAPSTFVGPGLAPDPLGNAKVFALNSVNGTILWAVETGNYILQTPLRRGDVLYVAGVFDDPEPIDEGGHTRLLALSAVDGTPLWAYESEDGFAKGLHATDTVVSFVGYQDFLNGVDTGTGELIWRRHTDNWVPDLAGEGETVYYGSANTVVHAISMPDGEVVWEYNIPEGTFNYVLGAPVPHHGSLYFVTQQGDIMALDADDGSLQWHYPTDIEARTGLSISGEWLFIGDTAGVVHAFKQDPA